MLDIAALSVMLIAVLFFGTLLVAAWRYPAEEPRRTIQDTRAAPRQTAQPAATTAAPVERPQPAQPARPAARRQSRREEAAARRRMGAAALVMLGTGLALPAATA